MYKALSVIEPYGELIMSGKKTIEVRSWIPFQMPLYDVVIVQNTNRLSTDNEEEPGFAIGLVDIKSCKKWSENDLAQSCCSTYSDGYNAWELYNIRQFPMKIGIMAKRKIYEITKNENDAIESIMNIEKPSRYWERLDKIISENRIIIDRKKGSLHPKYQTIVFPIDYGYIENTTSMDNGGIDLFYGTRGSNDVQVILCILDILKNDSEIKVLYSCTDQEIDIAKRFMESEYVSCILVKRVETNGIRT